MLSLRLLSLPAGIRWLSSLFALIGLSLCLVPSLAHEGHDHDEAARAALTAAAFPRTTSNSELYEAVGILKRDRLTFYLDRFATNEPVIGATVSVTIGDREAVEAEATPDGTYGVAFPKLTTVGPVEVVLNVGASSGDDLLVGTLSQSASTSGNPAPAAALSDAPRRMPDGTAFVAKPTQRLLNIRTVAAEPTTATPGVTLIGRVVGDPDRTSVVQSVYGGRVTALAGGFPRIGQKVRKGEPLVQITPHLPAADRTTISEKLGEIDQLIAVAEGKIRRLRPLAERNVVAMSQVIDAETELEGLKARRDTVRTLRAEFEVLTAPTDGVIAVAKAVQGQVVQGQDLLFQIVDPQALWVEALVYGGLDPATLGAATAAGPDGSSMSLEFRGFSRALQQHAALVHYAIVTPPANLSIGQPVAVTAGKGEPVAGLILARDAVVRSPAGEAVVWLHTDAEGFEPRPVRTQAFDATRLIVAAGLSQGERIVIRGADLINQVR